MLVEPVTEYSTDYFSPVHFFTSINLKSKWAGKRLMNLIANRLPATHRMIHAMYPNSKVAKFFIS